MYFEIGDTVKIDKDTAKSFRHAYNKYGDEANFPLFKGRKGIIRYIKRIIKRDVVIDCRYDTGFCVLDISEKDLKPSRLLLTEKTNKDVEA